MVRADEITCVPPTRRRRISESQNTRENVTTIMESENKSDDTMRRCPLRA